MGGGGGGGKRRGKGGEGGTQQTGARQPRMQQCTHSTGHAVHGTQPSRPSAPNTQFAVRSPQSAVRHTHNTQTPKHVLCDDPILYCAQQASLRLTLHHVVQLWTTPTPKGTRNLGENPKRARHPPRSSRPTSPGIVSSFPPPAMALIDRVPGNFDLYIGGYVSPLALSSATRGQTKGLTNDPRAASSLCDAVRPSSKPTSPMSCPSYARHSISACSALSSTC